MKNIISFFLFFSSLSAIAQQKQSLIIDSFIPKGYILFDKIYGDINKNSINDCVLIIKGTDKANIIVDTSGKSIDYNRRGLVILFRKNNSYEIAMKNLKCFSSENEDGGNYFAPELSIEIKNGNLMLHYSHGRYGYWFYTFKYQKSNFELIGYDAVDNKGPITISTLSINFLTKRKLQRINKNAMIKGAVEKYKVTWKNIITDKFIKLSEIKEIEELIMYNY